MDELHSIKFCPSLFSIAVINAMTQNNLRGKGFSSSLWLTVHNEGTLGTRARTEADIPFQLTKA